MKQMLIVVFCLVLSGFAGAQTAAPVPGGVCFVQAQRVLESMPDGAKVVEARKNAEAELAPLQAQIGALQQKIQAGSATAAERQQYDTLVQSYNARAKALQAKIAKLLEPITKLVDAAIAQVAPLRGCAVVLDRDLAASSGLVVYANPSTDITQDVIAALQPR